MEKLDEGGGDTSAQIDKRDMGKIVCTTKGHQGVLSSTKKTGERIHNNARENKTHNKKMKEGG